MYEQANEKYLKTYSKEVSLRSNIARILHQADVMATFIEADEWTRGDKKETKRVAKSVSNIKKVVETEVDAKLKGENAKDLFDELFGDKK